MTADRIDFEELGRFDAGDEQAGDLAVLEQLEAAGADLKKPTDLRHVLHFTDEAGMLAAGRQLTSQGYRCKGHGPSADGGPFVLEAGREVVPTLDAIAEMRDALRGVATSEGGTYEDFEAAVTP